MNARSDFARAASVAAPDPVKTLWDRVEAMTGCRITTDGPLHPDDIIGDPSDPFSIGHGKRGIGD